MKKAREMPEKCVNKKCFLNGSMARVSKVENYNYPEPESGCRKFDRNELKQCPLYEEDTGECPHDGETIPGWNVDQPHRCAQCGEDL